MKFWKRYQFRRRLSRVPPQLAQDLELMAGALRAGSSLVQAIHVAAEEGHGILAEDWKSFLKDIRLGSNLNKALAALEERLPIPAIRSFAMAVLITQESGGNLAGVLLSLAGTLRQEITFQGKLKALTAQGKISGYIVSAMPFALMGILYVMAPELIAPLFTTGLGHLLLVAVIVLEAMGAFVIKKIITIEV